MYVCLFFAFAQLTHLDALGMGVCLLLWIGLEFVLVLGMSTTMHALFGLATLITAAGDNPGFCFKNGTGGQGGPYCRSGYERPEGIFILRFQLPCIYSYLPSYWCKSTGVCNCATGLNSCLANLAGCAGAHIGFFVPPIPPVLCVGTHYEFKINISSANFNDLCFLRPLPAGLSWVVLSSQYPYN